MAVDRRTKRWVFFLEGVNSLSATLFFNYVFFFFQGHYGFSTRQNLWIATLHGAIYAVSSWFGGRTAQRIGYFQALKRGFFIMTLALAGAAFAPSLPLQLICIYLWSWSICLTWPSLEALACEGEPPSRLERIIGLYNITWAGTSAVGTLIGGLLMERFGPRCCFWIPAAINGAQFVFTFFLHAKVGDVPRRGAAVPVVVQEQGHSVPTELNPRPIARARTFLHLAWAANPFSYIAINTAIPLMPVLATALALSPSTAGIFCSLWFFVRMASFWFLSVWPGWHYRAGWFLSSYLLLGAGFALMLMGRSIPVVGLGQVAFGLATGLLYHSSLYYSMNASDTKGEHGGVHEAMIGMGIGAGPAIGAVSLQLFPGVAQAAPLGVSSVLALGGSVLLWIWFKDRGTRVRL